MLLEIAIAVTSSNEYNSHVEELNSIMDSITNQEEFETKRDVISSIIERLKELRSRMKVI